MILINRMDSQELQLITQRFDAVTAVMTTQFKGVNERLDKINGRVGKTEDEIQVILVEKAISTEKQNRGLKELDELYVKVEEIDNKERNHVSLCPIVPKMSDIDKRIRTLEDNSLATITKKNLIMSALGILVVLITITLGSIQLNEKFRESNTNRVIQQNDSILSNQIKFYENVMRDAELIRQMNAVEVQPPAEKTK